MAPRRRALELASRRGAGGALRRILHEGHAGAAFVSGWRPGSEGIGGNQPSTSSTSGRGGGALDLLFLKGAFGHYQRKSSSSSSSSFASSSHHRGFVASARDEEPKKTDRRPKEREEGSCPAGAVLAEEAPSSPPPSSSSSSSSSSSLSSSSSSPPPSSCSSSSPLSSHWLSRVLPLRLWPYAELARLDKPAGTWLLAWPCAWSTVLATASPSSSPCPAALASASQSSPAVVDALLVSADLASTAHLLALFGVGALLLRGAGCTVNDLWDREIDKKVTRTASRPLARGAVSPAEAAAFLAAQLAAGAAVLSQLNPASVVVGVAALPLVALYPLAKRVTDWPQAVLGLTFNWGALLGWTAVKGGSESALEMLARSAGAAAREAGSSSSSFALEPALAALSSAAAAPALSSLASSPAPWLLYSAGVCWTLAYDTIYAYQDSSEDVEAGVRSSALALRSLGLERAGVAAFGVAAVALLAAAGASAGIGGAVFYGSVLLGPGVHMAWQVGTLDPRDPRNCAERFRSNAAFGGLAAAAIAAGVAASQG